MRWVGYAACMGEGRNVYKVLLGKPKGKRPLGRLRHRCKYGINMNLREIGWGGGGGVSVLNEFTWLRIGIRADSHECDDEPLGSGAMESFS
jgi:hypothetical protein